MFKFQKREEKAFLRADALSEKDSFLHTDTIFPFRSAASTKQNPTHEGTNRRHKE